MEKVHHVYISQFSDYEGQEVLLKGWVANRRTTKNVVFVVFRDGTGFTQLVIDKNLAGEEAYQKADKLGLETAIEVKGKVVRDERQIGGFEVHVTEFKVIGPSENYPIAKKEHGIDFLLDHRHLWLRHRRPWATMRIRNEVVYAIHKFFQDRGFLQLDAPIFTANACEGTTTLFETDFFGEPAYLSQSGQLYGEAMAMAYGKIYVFGPTFRAEKSKTRRHLAEFWMVEPEMAFYDLDMTMDLMEDFVKFLIQHVLQNRQFELSLLDRDTTILESSATKPYPRITYDEAVEIIKGTRKVNGRSSLDVLKEDLAKAHEEIKQLEEEEKALEKQLEAPGLGEKKKARLQGQLGKVRERLHKLRERAKNIPLWIEQAENFPYGDDFGGAHETVLTRLFDTPIMVYKWPRDIKAFYMKPFEDDPNFVKGVDMLAPEGYGEIIGGGERETDLNALLEQIRKHHLPEEAFQWYLDLRRYGSVPHSGFGLGLERFIAWMAGLHHVREAIPFPRYYGRLTP